MHSRDLSTLKDWEYVLGKHLTVLGRLFALLRGLELCWFTAVVPYNRVGYIFLDDCAFFVGKDFGSILEVSNGRVHFLWVLAVMDKVNGSLDLRTH